MKKTLWDYLADWFKAAWKAFKNFWHTRYIGSCGKCAYYYQVKGEYGHCLRFPPVIIGEKPNNFDSWHSPVVTVNFGCGEFKRKPGW